MSRAIVAYSFGGNRGRPGKPNMVLASLVAQESKWSPDALILVQDHIAVALPLSGVEPDLVVKKHPQEKFFGTEEVTRQFTEFLRTFQVSQVFLVAHPFLHRYKCRRLLEQQGFEVEVVPTAWIPFDPYCKHWWVRSPFHLLAYALLQFFFGRQGR